MEPVPSIVIFCHEEWNSRREFAWLKSKVWAPSFSAVVRMFKLWGIILSGYVSFWGVIGNKQFRVRQSFVTLKADRLASLRESPFKSNTSLLRFSHHSVGVALQNKLHSDKYHLRAPVDPNHTQTLHLWQFATPSITITKKVTWLCILHQTFSYFVRQICFRPIYNIIFDGNRGRRLV